MPIFVATEAVELERGQLGLACGTAARIGERGGLSVRDAFRMEVVNAAGGGDGLHAEDLPLAYGTVCLPCGVPQLKAAVEGEPVDLPTFRGVVLGAT